MTNESPHVNFRAVAPLDEELQARAGAHTIGMTARRCIERYLSVVAQGADELRYSEPEWALILDALNGVWLGDGQSWQTAWAEVADHIDLNRAHEQHGVRDPDDLVSRLRGASVAARLALVDVVERWWALDDDARAGEIAQSLGLLGVVMVTP